MNRILHVATTGSDAADGSEESPFRTISRAADAAVPGDTVRVHGGEYREWVKPPRGGLSETRRITYEAAPGEHVVIKGSERVTDWEHVDGELWRTRVPNAVFGDWNPFAEELRGDWVVRPEDSPVHLGDVYVNGMGSYEAASLAEVAHPVARQEIIDDWTGTTVPVADPDPRLWHAEVEETHTVITVNLAGADPREELVEISVRRSVFVPVGHHVNYVTVRGFELCHAATPWAPPTADQPGLIGPNWAKGWIIEDNHIHHAKCSAVSLGKERSTGHNFATDRGDKPGYQYQVDHNVLASPASLEIFSQGGAYIGNLVTGTVRVAPVLDRATPYHVPHSTQVAGYAVIQTGDDRFIGNIFVGGDAGTAYAPGRTGDRVPGYGTAAYDGHPASFDAYLASIPDERTDHRRFAGVPQPVYIRGNVYAGGATPYVEESSPTVLDHDLEGAVREDDGRILLELDVPDRIDRARLGAVSGADLGHVRIVGAEYEEPDGSPVRIDVDLLGEERTAQSAAGPIGSLTSGKHTVPVW